MRRQAGAAVGARGGLARRLARVAQPEWRRISALYVLGLAATPLALLTPVPLKIAVDSGLGSHPLPPFLSGLVPGAGEPSDTAVLALAAGLVVAVALLTQVQQLAAAVLAASTGERLLLRLRSEVFRHAERLSLAYHDSRGTADSAYRIQYDAMAIQWIVTTGLAPLFGSALTVLAMVWVTALIDWQLVLVALCIAPLLLALTHVYRRRLRRDWHTAKELESSALSVVGEVLGSLRVVKAFGREDHERDRFVRAAAEGMQARVRLAVLEGAFGLLLGVTTAVGTAVVLFVGARRVQSGAITLGDLLLVMGYLTQLYTPLQAISRTAGRLQSSLASAERVFTVLDEPGDVPEAPDARPLARTAGRVSFRDVGFGYNGRPVLDRVFVEIPPGSRVAVTGVTGAGKTTLVNLLTRFYDPTDGVLFLDGVDLRAYRLADLRAQFAIVLQEPVLFSTTVGENIAYARPDAREAEVVAAARAADAHDFVMRLPEGYATPVGERGMTLSGGERQRIALARAFLKDAPILILDEPTSSVDVVTEASILQAMQRLMEGRTTFLIAHRQSTLRGCDIRLEVQGGRVHQRSPRAATTALAGAA